MTGANLERLAEIEAHLDEAHRLAEYLPPPLADQLREVLEEVHFMQAMESGLYDQDALP